MGKGGKIDWRRPLICSTVAGKVVLFVMTMATISLLVAIITEYLVGQPEMATIPRLVRLVAFKYLARIVGLSKQVPVAPKQETTNPETGAATHFSHHKRSLALQIHPVTMPNAKTATDITVTDIGLDEPKTRAKIPTSGDDVTELIAELRKITAYIAQKEADDSVCSEWKFLAKVIDRCLFWLCLLVTVVTGLVVIITLIIK